MFFLNMPIFALPEDIAIFVKRIYNAIVFRNSPCIISITIIGILWHK